MQQTVRAFGLVLLVLIAIKVAAALVDVAIGPIAALLGLILVFMWLFGSRHH